VAAAEEILLISLQVLNLEIRGVLVAVAEVQTILGALQLNLHTPVGLNMEGLEMLGVIQTKANGAAQVAARVAQVAEIRVAQVAEINRQAQD
jgi:hypothetical protein